MDPKRIQEASREIAELLGYSDGARRAKREMFAKYGWSPKRTGRLIKAILATWHAEGEAQRKYDKIRQVRRIEGHVRGASTRGAWREVAALETQLARIIGTEAPLAVKVDVNLGPVVGAVLTGMDAATMARMAAEFDELQRLAGRTIVVPALPEHEPAAVVRTDDEAKKPST